MADQDTPRTPSTSRAAGAGDDAPAAPSLVAVPGGRGEAAARVRRAAETGAALLANLCSVVRGKEHEIRLVLCALACEGHVLFEDVPGTAKTVLARAIGQSVEGLAVSRVQCTPDLQPADVTGLSVYDQRTRDFEFRPGPLFANVVLVDEINRATQKTQSALLEAMAERQVTVDGATRPLPVPFLLLATENPIEHEGTFFLPEAQLDRFFLRTGLGYPDAADELRVVLDQRRGHPLDALGPVATVGDVLGLQRAVEDVYIDPLLQRWVVELVRGTRRIEIAEVGASVRGSLALERGARAWALLDGRDHVEPRDVEELFLPVLGHRVLFSAPFVTAVRGLERGAALAELRRRCLALAPPPGLG
jgi:MoxR-like ATPase